MPRIARRSVKFGQIWTLYYHNVENRRKNGIECQSHFKIILTNQIRSKSIIISNGVRQKREGPITDRKTGMFPVLRIVEGFRLKKELREVRVEIKILEIRRVRDHLRQLITDTAGDLFRRKDPQDQDERYLITL